MVKDVQKLIELIEGNGYEVRRNGSSAKIYKDGELVVDPYNDQALTLHYTPSDWRWKTTKETQLMRAGVLTPEQLGKRKSDKGAAVAVANSREKRLEQTVELAGRLETIIAEHQPRAGQARLARALSAYGKINSLGLWKTPNAAQVFLSNVLRLEHTPQQRFIDGLAAFLDHIATDPAGRIKELEQKNERRLAEMKPERPEPEVRAGAEVEPPRKVIRLLNKGEAISEAPAIRVRIEKLMAVMGDYNGVKSDLSRCAHRFADRQMRGFNWHTEQAAIQGILKWLKDPAGTTSGAPLSANKLSILVNLLDYLDEGETKAKWNELLGLGLVRRDATPQVRGRRRRRDQGRQPLRRGQCSRPPLARGLCRGGPAGQARHCDRLRAPLPHRGLAQRRAARGRRG